MQDSIAIYRTSTEDMAKKTPKPQGPVSTRLTPEQLERLARFMESNTGTLSRNEVMQILFEMALDMVEEDPQSFVRAHLKMQEGRVKGK
jgi:hypothetical protein